MAKGRGREQINIRISSRGRDLLAALVAHYTARSDTGRPATQTDVLERALRALAAREKVSRKGD